MDKRRAAASFLGYFRNWEMFSHDIAAHRDQTIPAQKLEEQHVVHAIDLLAYIVGDSRERLQGSYQAVQANGRHASGDRDFLMHYYIKVAKDYSRDPAEALRGIEGIEPPLGPDPAFGHAGEGRASPDGVQGRHAPH